MKTVLAVGETENTVGKRGGGRGGGKGGGRGPHTDPLFMSGRVTKTSERSLSRQQKETREGHPEKTHDGKSLKTETPLPSPTSTSRSYVRVMLPFKQRCDGGRGERRLRLLGPLMIMMMMMTMVTADVEGLDGDESEEILEDEVDEEIVESSDVSRVSPMHSWLIFRRNSNKGDNRRVKASKRSSRHGLPGPPGPPGPQGPPGPPAPPKWERQELVEELQQKLQGQLTGVCLGCNRAPRVAASFLSRIPQPVAVPRRSLVELQSFSQAGHTENRLQRGGSFNVSTGRYSAPVSGFYQVTASLLIESGERLQLRLRDSVRASVCIESLCQRNLSVQAVVGVAASGGMFSMLLTGALYLQAGEYVSVFVDNATGSSISVLPDSSFSGILLGV